MGRARTAKISTSAHSLPKRTRRLPAPGSIGSCSGRAIIQLLFDKSGARANTLSKPSSWNFKLCSIPRARDAQGPCHPVKETRRLHYRATSALSAAWVRAGRDTIAGAHADRKPFICAFNARRHPRLLVSAAGSSLRSRATIRLRSKARASAFPRPCSACIRPRRHRGSTHLINQSKP